MADLKDAPDRLNQHSRNSSRPPDSNSVYRQPVGPRSVIRQRHRSTPG
ncbi:hypothetical protein [Accumulibacter sp.]